MSKRLGKLFSNGIGRVSWLENNCNDCARYHVNRGFIYDLPVDDPGCCPIEAAICRVCGGTLDDIPDDIWKRLNIPDNAEPIADAIIGCPECITEIEYQQERIRAYAKHNHDIFPACSTGGHTTT